MGPIQILPLFYILHVFPNGSGRDKKIKAHLYDRSYDPHICTDNIVGDEPLNGEVQTMRGASGPEVLTGGNRTLMSPSSSTYMHPNTPWNLGTIPKTGKDKDFKLFPRPKIHQTDKWPPTN